MAYSRCGISTLDPFGPDYDLIRGLASDLALALTDARVLNDALGHALDLDLALELPVRGLARFRNLDHRHPEREVKYVTSSAAWLLAAVTRGLLPTADRTRYDGEFRSELWEIAHGGGGRRAQLAYAIR